MLYSLILAGGKGTRLYPLSRGQEPKQFLKVANDKSFLVNTVDRISPLIPSENTFVITNKDYEERVKQELPELNPENIFVEPANKETATCIGLAAVKLMKKDKDAVMVVLPSDHYIENNKSYIETLKQAVVIVERRNAIVTIGIEPTRPEMGYGYIEMGTRVSGNIPSYKVNRFTEKPNLEVAKDFILKGTYLWNSGMFVMKADTIIKEIERYIPKLGASLRAIRDAIGTEEEEEVTRRQYSLVDGISIDFGVMQRTRRAMVVKCDFSWDDIGSFTALSRFLKTEDSNAVSEEVYLEESKNCCIFGGKRLIIGFGLKDLVIVDTGDVLLVMDKNRDQEIKHLIGKIADKKEYKDYL